MKVLVTGGNGFIGRVTAAELQQRGHDPVIFDRADSCFSAEREIFLGDIRDATAITEAVAHVDGVIHLAGVLGTQETIANPRPAAETNILGGLNVLEACSQYKVPLVNIAVGNWFEHSTYSISKSTVERFTVMYARYRSLPACSVRAYNAYGPGQSVAQPYGTSRVRKIIPSFITRALHHEPIQVYGDGMQVMDMIYVADVARCLVQALENGPSGGALWVAGTGRRTTVREIAELVRAEVWRETGTGADIEYLPMRPGETPGSEVLADPDRLVPGVDSLISLEGGLHETVLYYRKLFGK
jgi:UDP-glucose 4-epimerase